MRVLLLGLICLSAQTIFATESAEEPTLESVVKDYYSLQKSIDQLIKTPKADCSPDGQKESTPYCSVKTICENPAINYNSPYLYSNEKGERVINTQYFKVQDDLRSCLKDKFDDEIKEKRSAFVEKVANPHLKRIIEANKKLNRLAVKYNQGSAIQKISAEILTMTMEAGLNNETIDWEQKNATPNELFAVLSKAEKRTRIKLKPEIKSTLTEIAYLKNNPLYLKDIEKFDREVIPQMQKKNPLDDFSFLLDADAAGGEASLEKNRELLKNKAQNAYEIFKQVKEDMFAYLATKITPANSANMTRILQRLSLLKFEPPRLTKNVMDKCQYPNAFFDSSTHTVTVCPSFLNMPALALYETLAHEVAHSFDSCNLSGKFYKAKGPGVVEDASFEIDLSMDPVNGNYLNTYYSDPQGFGLQRRLQDKMKFKDHPFSSVMSCLSDPKSIGAVVHNRAEVIKELDKKIEAATARGETPANNSGLKYLLTAKENADDYFDHFEGCSFSTPNILVKTQLQESFSDKMASELVAKKFKEATTKDSEKMITELVLSYGACNKKEEALQKLDTFASTHGCSEFFDAKNLENKIITGLNIALPAFSEHPDTDKRMEKIFLAHPEIRKALKCKSNEGLKYCE